MITLFKRRDLIKLHALSAFGSEVIFIQDIITAFHQTAASLKIRT